MKLAAILFACIVGMNQWKVDRMIRECDGSAPDVVSYGLERQVVTPVPYSCEVCCDDPCSEMCGAVCYDYVRGPWVEVDQVPEPGAGDTVCYDWDSSPAGDFRGSHFPGPGDVWFLRNTTIDAAGNIGREPCP